MFKGERIVVGCILGMGLAGLSGCYVTKQAYWQTKLLLGREPIEEVESIPPRQKQLIAEVLDQAEAIGLNVGGAYKHVVFPKDNTVSWSVSASFPLELKSYTWWFPIVGRVPYKGYYDQAECEEEAAQLKASGYDVIQNRVSAFSSLGWFSDPIFPSMLKNDDNQLAHLLFHELTHRTIWISGGVEMNENLAEFIAEKATLRFLTSKKIDSTAYQMSRLELGQFADWVAALELDLKALYARADLLDEQKIVKKQEIFARHFEKRPPGKARDYIGNLSRWNNARVLATKTYLGRQEQIENKYNCFRGFQTSKSQNDDLKNFIAAIKKDKEMNKLEECKSI
jgi:predicted aminopeptidase